MAWIVLAQHVLLLGLSVADGADESGIEAEHWAFFDSRIHPLLEIHCYSCHGGKEKINGGLRLTSRAALLRGGDSGPAVDLAVPESSRLLAMISYRDDLHQMPPDGKLPSSVIDTFSEWIRLGAPYNPARELTGTIKEAATTSVVNQRNRNYWAFQQVSRPEVPLVADPEWNANPIDAFVYSRLAAAEIKPNEQASAQQLIRRAFYDLIGLPPTASEVRAFVANPSPRAFEIVVDDLLARPQYGEKWGRHWLDLVRYAESNGYERDSLKPLIWRYRDYVIDSFNADMPYDRFLIEQLAGDEVRPYSSSAHIATGYYRLGIWNDDTMDKRQAFYDGLDDILSVTAQTMLGLTIACARCHDHKADPILQRDYYSLLAFLDNIRPYYRNGLDSTIRATVRPLLPPGKNKTAMDQLRVRELRKRKIDRVLRQMDKRAGEKLDDAEKKEYRSEQNRIPILRRHVRDWIGQGELGEYIAAFEDNQVERVLSQNAPDMALVVTERGTVPEETRILIRGNAQAPGAPVKPAFPSILSPDPLSLPAPATDAGTSGRRSVLARWMASRENPLTARVWVNRLWQYHFGRGIVRSSDDFGRSGVAPTHPELLDWLASEFMSGEWKIKRMHKMIMLSKAYRMSSIGRAESNRKDPRNDLFWRFNMRRLTAEEIRDSAINLTGNLNLRMGGPGVHVEMPIEVLKAAARPRRVLGISFVNERNRRSVYLSMHRSLREPVLETFDMANADMHCSVRYRSIVPTQSLTMLNGKFFNDVAIGFASRLCREAGESRRARVQMALSLVFNRDPNSEEISKGVRWLTEFETLAEKGAGDQAGRSAIERFCLLALNLNEFIFLD